jgi:hypothetical protein
LSHILLFVGRERLTVFQRLRKKDIIRIKEMTFRISFNGSLVLTAALVGSVSITQAFAQPAPRGGQGRGQGRGVMQGQPMGGNQNRMGGQMGSFGMAGGINQRGGQMPQVMGTIANGDASTGRLLVESPWDGSIHIVQVTGNTQILTQAAVAVTDLRVGDVVQVPNGGWNNVSDVVAAEQSARAFRGGSSNRQGGTGRSASGTNGIANVQGFQRPQQQIGAPPMLGRVSAVEPWAVTLENGQTTALETNSRASRIVSIPFRNLKVGDQVVAMGQPSSDGSFIAATLAVNMDTSRGRGQTFMPRNQQSLMQNGVPNAGAGQSHMNLQGGQRRGDRGIHSAPHRPR